MATRTARRPAGDSHATEDIRDAVWRLKRETIVAAAVDIFYHKGYAKTTLEEVADAIHVTKPFIYSHFKSKHDLLAEICSRALIVSHEALTRASSQAGTPGEKLAMIARDFMYSLLTHQAHSVIYSREEKELDPDVCKHINQLRRDFDHRLEEVIAQGVASGEFVVQDVGLAALAIIGIVAWSQFWYRPGGRLTKEQTADGVASLVLSMVGAKGAHAAAVEPQVIEVAALS
ncbi:MAG: TetR family transcriptional regulator [Rhodoferax sp.]|nr:TetR family transcriptional regulator [Rhodoferax sp.]